MAVVKLTLEYDGTDFAGWAAQPGLRTVEEEVRKALDGVYPGWERLAVAGLSSGPGSSPGVGFCFAGGQGGGVPAKGSRAAVLPRSLFARNTR
jgi:hypothetical protein